MTDEQVPAVCCENADPETSKPCALCGTITCKDCRSFVDRQRVCPACREQIESELTAEKAGAFRLPPAILGGVVGAVLGGAIWAGVAMLADLEVGYVALAVGWLAGMGVVIASGGKKGFPLQIVAVACSVLGLLLGKYFTMVFAIKREYPGTKDMSLFDSEFIEFFPEVLKRSDPIDLLFLVLALAVAFGVPKATQLPMSRRKN